MTSSSSENLMNLEPWMYRSSSTTFNDSWLAEAFARDSETLTRALQQSLLSNNNSDTFIAYDNNTTSIANAMSPLVSGANPALSSGSDHDAMPNRRKIGAAASGKIAKRKSRASKRCTTTFINADPANFRQMVQQVTGVKFSGGNYPAVVGGVLKTEPQRDGGRSMPTIDTSAFLVDQYQYQQQEVSPGTDVSFTTGGGDGGGGLDFNSFSCFPTLESWKVM